MTKKTSSTSNSQSSINPAIRELTEVVRNSTAELTAIVRNHTTELGAAVKKNSDDIMALSTTVQDIKSTVGIMQSALHDANRWFDTRLDDITRLMELAMSNFNKQVYHTDTALTGTLLRKLAEDLRKSYYKGLKIYAPNSFKKPVWTPDMKYDDEGHYFDGNLMMLLNDVVGFILASETFAPLFIEAPSHALGTNQSSTPTAEEWTPQIRVLYNSYAQYIPKDLHVEDDEATKEVQYLRSALRAVAIIHLDMMRAYQDEEKRMGDLFPSQEDSDAAAKSRSTVGQHFRFWTFLNQCRRIGLDVTSLNGQMIANTFITEANPQKNELVVLFDESLKAIKTLSSALLISSTPSLVAFMLIRAHNKVGLNLNTFAHPEFEATSTSAPDEYHRRHQLLEAYQLDYLRSPALVRAWDNRINYADVLEWSSNQWNYVCNKAETTTLQGIPTVWTAMNILDIGQTQQPMIGEVKQIDAIKRFKKMKVTTESWASVAKPLQKPSPRPTIALSSVSRQAPYAAPAQSSAMHSLAFSSPVSSISAPQVPSAGSQIEVSLEAMPPAAAEGFALSVSRKWPSLVNGPAQYLLAEAVVRALAPLLGLNLDASANSQKKN